jgi:sRNA-binding regulator protein Hfq
MKKVLFFTTAMFVSLQLLAQTNADLETIRRQLDAFEKRMQNKNAGNNANQPAQRTESANQNRTANYQNTPQEQTAPVGQQQQQQVFERQQVPNSVERSDWTAAASSGNTSDVVYLKNGNVMRGTIVEQIPGKTISLITKDGNLMVLRVDDVRTIRQSQNPAGWSNISVSGNSQNVVYLKNGSVIRGTIIEQIPGKTISLKTKDDNIMVFYLDEIDRIGVSPVSGGSRGLRQGYKGILELDYAIGTGDWKVDRLNLQFINGYQVNPYFSLGIGTGAHYYFDAEAVLIPVFADFRANFIDNAVSPYLAFDIGYSFDATNDFKGLGMLLGIGVGATLKTSNSSAINIGIGYEMQKDKLYISNGYYYYETSSSISYGAFCLKLGISF